MEIGNLVHEGNVCPVDAPAVLAKGIQQLFIAFVGLLRRLRPGPVENNVDIMAYIAPADGEFGYVFESMFVKDPGGDLHLLVAFARPCRRRGREAHVASGPEFVKTGFLLDDPPHHQLFAIFEGRVPLGLLFGDNPDFAAECAFEGAGDVRPVQGYLLGGTIDGAVQAPGRVRLPAVSAGRLPGSAGQGTGIGNDICLTQRHQRFHNAAEHLHIREFDAERHVPPRWGGGASAMCRAW